VFREKFPKLQRAGYLTATSYASRRDRALWFSSLLHSGPRLGLFDDAALPTQGLEAIDSTAVDRGLLAHGYWSGARPLITDLRMLLLQGLGAKARGLEAIGQHWAFPK
jgi:esterase/lipase superfamily enzyme